MVADRKKVISGIKKKHKALNIDSGVAHISCSFNNTIITISDVKGNCLAWSSPGVVGFKGARRSTSYAAQLAAEDVGKRIFDKGIRSVAVVIKGLGDGRESSVRGLQSIGLTITNIKDITPIPFNGCRPPKRRRI